jgi:hypothetical protein
MQFESDDEPELLALVRHHAHDAHGIDLTDDQIRDLMEVAQ